MTTYKPLLTLSVLARPLYLQDLLFLVFNFFWTKLFPPQTDTPSRLVRQVEELQRLLLRWNRGPHRYRTLLVVPPGVGLSIAPRLDPWVNLSPGYLGFGILCLRVFVSLRKL